MMTTLQQQESTAQAKRTTGGSQSAKSHPSRTIVHAKLEMTEPGDHDEQEADAVANTIVSGGKIARKISGGGGGSSGIAVSQQMESQLSQLQGGGRQMPEGLRNMMESGFGRDFSQVRLHTDGEAADMSSSIHAKAFTHGNDIYFNQGQFSPNTSEGQKLMAHELTHVTQGTGKVGRDVIPMKEVVEANQEYCQNKECEAEYVFCQTNYNTLGNIISGNEDSIYMNLHEILNKVKNRLVIDVPTGFATASIIAGSIAGLATIVAAFPPATIPAGIVAGVSSIASIIFNEKNASEVSNYENQSQSIIDIIANNTKNYLLEIRDLFKKGTCVEGKIQLCNDPVCKERIQTEEISYNAIRIELLNLQEKFSHVDNMVEYYVDNIKKTMNIAAIKFTEPRAQAWIDHTYYHSGYMLAKVGNELMVVNKPQENFFNYSKLYSFDSKYPMPEDEQLKNYVNEKYLSQYRDLTYIQQTNWAWDKIKNGDFDKIKGFLSDALTPHDNKEQLKEYWLVEKKYTITEAQLKDIYNCFSRSMASKGVIVLDEERFNKILKSLTTYQQFIVKRAIDNIDYRTLEREESLSKPIPPTDETILIDINGV